MAVQINVLILKCDYKGIYDSFGEFYKNIEHMFLEYGAEVIYANSIDEAIEILQRNDVDFTINVGQYPYYYEGKPLYDIFETVNYQWVIDNPLRYPFCDMDSQYNRMIYIDSHFALYPNCGRADYLNISLPYPKYNDLKSASGNNSVLAPMKVKDIDTFEQRIESSDDKDLLKKFIRDYNLDDSFNLSILKFVSDNNISNLSEFFEIANGYIRVRKRVLMLQAIKKHEVFVLSEKPENKCFNNNILFLGKRNYTEYLKLQNEFKIVLNSNPNFDSCIHDRVSSAIMNGRLIVSDYNEMLMSIDMPMCFEYSEVFKLDDILEEAERNFELIHNKQVDCLRKSNVPCAESIINNYIDFK